MKRLFDTIYSKTLKRKKELNKFNYYKRIEVPNDAIEKKNWLNFSKALKLPLVNQSSFYIYDNIFTNNMVNNRYPIDPKKVYTFLQFASLTRTMIQIESNGIVIDPALCSIYVTGHNTSVIIVNGNISNVTVTILKGIYSYNRFTTNTNMVIPSDMLNSFMVFNNGVIDYIQPVLNNGTYRIPINGVGRVITVVLSPNILVYRSNPISADDYNYIPFPVGTGFVDLPNIQLMSQGQIGITIPTEHTPMYDGVKVNDTSQKIMIMYNRNIPKYEDLIHQYNKYRDYIQEFTNGTLPEYIANYQPYMPTVTDETTFEEFRQEMLEALKDFPNFYREYLEKQDSFQFTTHTLSNYSIAIRVNPKNMLFFNDGLNISPYEYTRSNNGIYTLRFKPEDIIGDVIYSLDIGPMIEPYMYSTKILSEEVAIGPHLQITGNSVVVYETSEDMKLTLEFNVLSMACSDVNHVLYVGCDNARLYKVDLYTMTILSQSEQFPGNVLSIVIDNNEIFVGIDTEFKILKLDPETLDIITESNNFNDISMVNDIHINGSNIITKGPTGTNTLISINRDTLQQITQGPSLGGEIKAIAIGNDGYIFISQSNPSVIKRLNPNTLAQLSQVSINLGEKSSMIIGNDNKLYAGGENQIVTKISTSLQIETSSISLGSNIKKLSKTKDGTIFALLENNLIKRITPVILTVESSSDTFEGEIVDLISFDDYLFIGGNVDLGVIRLNSQPVIPSKKRKYEKIEDFSYQTNVTNGTIIFDSSHVGKNIHVCTDKYNYVINKPYSGLATISLPPWVSFIDTSNIMIFLKGRFMGSNNSYIFNPFEYTFMKGKAAIAFDIDTDIEEGETISVYMSSNLERIQHTEILTNGEKIIEVTDKLIPFSTKYNLVFVNGKLIHPSKIQIIDNYRFSIDTDSIHNLYIFRKKFIFDYSEQFENIKDKWTTFLETMTVSQIETLFGITLFEINDNESEFSREIYYDKRHLFEIFYEYCLKGKRKLTIEEQIAIKEELTDILLPDGRIPISTFRPGQPRYKL